MKTEQNIKIQLHQTFPLTIKRLGINGEGVGYFKKQVVFVPGALPGEEVVVEATKISPKFAEAKIKKSASNLHSGCNHRVLSMKNAAAVSFSICAMTSSLRKNGIL